jgi:hypothetical protein
VLELLLTVQFQYRALERYSVQMQKRYTVLKTSLNLAKSEKSNVDDLLAAAELQNITLRDSVQELKGIESRMDGWKKSKSQEINQQFSTIPSLKR